MRVFQLMHDIVVLDRAHNASSLSIKTNQSITTTSTLRISRQVQYQQPVCTIGAFNKESPFHHELCDRRRFCFPCSKQTYNEQSSKPARLSQPPAPTTHAACPPRPPAHRPNLKHLQHTEHDLQQLQVEETILPRRRANKSQPVTLRHFSHWPRRIV